MKTCGHFRAVVTIAYRLDGRGHTEPDMLVCASCACTLVHRWMREGFVATWAGVVGGERFESVVINPAGHRAEAWWPHVWEFDRYLESSAWCDARELKNYRDGASA